METNNGLYVWGYVQKTVPEQVHFVPYNSFCSLETAADYLGADNVVYMNSNHDIETLRGEFLQRLGRKSIVCGLTHGSYTEAAERVSLLSLEFPNITGALIDDFLDELGNYYKGPSAGMEPSELAEIQEALKKYNPDLKLYLVRYTRQNASVLIPFLPYFDVLNLWCWCSTRDYWMTQYQDQLAQILAMYQGKPVMQGIFVHHYGLDSNGDSPAMSLDVLEVQCEKISEELRYGHLASWCVLQNGWFSLPSHRRQVQFLYDFFKWHYGTTTFPEK